MRSFVMDKRTDHISRVYRKVSTDPKPLINTIDGPAYIMISKHCQSCKTMQPLNNFYFISESKMKKYGYDENDAKSRENICITCWDKKQ